MALGSRPLQILVSAGEASGDLYAAGVVRALQRRLPGASFFGCAGEAMRRAGVEPVVEAASLSVVGIVEVLHHIPRIYREFRRLRREAALRRPDLAILTDSPDFHLRLAAALRKLEIPVLYLVAPQVWAWRKHRIRTIRRNVNRLACIFPFEEEFFRNHGVPADYIGHPLSWLVRAAQPREEFFGKHRIATSQPLIALLPGSRPGEVARHLPVLHEAVRKISAVKDTSFALGVPEGFLRRTGAKFFSRKMGELPVRIIEGETWDLEAHADLALAASGTVTVETALAGTPMVTFYRVAAATWWLGRPFVKVPYYTMVNLVAGRKVVPELIQHDCTGSRLAAEALRLLENPEAVAEMRRGLNEVRQKLHGDAEPFERAAEMAEDILRRNE